MSQYKIWFQGATDRVHMAPYISYTVAASAVAGHIADPRGMLQ